MALTAQPGGVALHCDPGPSRLVHDASTTLYIKYACHLDQSDGASWFGIPALPPSPYHDKLAPNSSLADSYAESLWLGEFHTGLSQFLHGIDRLRSSYELEDVLLGLCQLVKSNSAISRRHQAAGHKLQSTTRSKINVSETTLDMSEYESTLVQRAIDKATSSQMTGTDADALRERWTSSMESREIQLQILITMCLLQIVSEEPRALETARSRLLGTSTLPADVTKDAAPDNDDQPRKRSRKLEKAKRWRGPRPHADDDAFAWNQKRRRLATDSSHDDGDQGEAEVLEVQGVDVLAVEHLSKRLEALVDILCLRQVATGLGSEISDLLSDMTGDTMGDEKGKAALFGSSVRKLLADDDMDDAQWLCSSVVEPHFEASLPRQCSLFRSKCFVSLQSRTPARPNKVLRSGSLGSPPIRAKRISNPGLAIAGGGLSDVLEKEQARRVKRNLAEQRSTMLGRGREVDMGRRLSRSISATLGPSRQSQTQSGAFSRSNTQLFTQPNMETNTKSYSLKVERSASQTPTMRSSALSSRPSFAASSTQPSGGSKRLLVLSTPQKEPASKSHFSQKDKPKLVFPTSLVMESPTQDGGQMLGQRGRMADRSASFGGRSTFQLKRSPSPFGFCSDVDD